MNKFLLETYSDFLIFNQGQASATVFSEATDGLISHDKFTRFLNHREYTGEDLWNSAKTITKNINDGVLAIDDFIIEKPYSEVSDINCYHYSHMRGRCIRGIEVLNAFYSNGASGVPVDYSIIEKPIEYCDLQTKKVKRKSLVSKNSLARKLIQSALNKCLNIGHITADSWFCCGENLNFINFKSKKYIFAIKSNRRLFLTKEDREKNLGSRLSELELEDETALPFFINNVDHQVYITKKTFTNGDGTRGVLFLVSNDSESSGSDLCSIYHKRWGIEVFHKSVKNNTSLAKSPAAKSCAQKNHIFCSFYGYLKLERAKEKEKKNHFKMKRDIQILMLKSCRNHYKESFQMAG
jgi:hypothetical protein